MKVAIVLPAYNEERSLGGVIDGIRKALGKSRYDYQILVVNDCSSDATAKVAFQKKVILINHTYNRGYGGALLTGFRKANEHNADIIITMDADGQHNPKDLKSLIGPIERDEADVVIGSRFLHGKTKFPFYRKLGISFFTAVTNILFGLNVSDCQSGLRAYSAEVIKDLKLTNHGMGISVETLARIAKKDRRITEVPCICDYAKAAYSKDPISHGMTLLKSLMMYYFEK